MNNNSKYTGLSADHQKRMKRTRLSLQGLSVGDCDTTCAIVGSIVALSVGIKGIPQEWLKRREKLELLKKYLLIK